MNKSSDRRKPILRWSIGTKLIIAFLALAVIPMSITAYYNLIRSRKEVAKVTKENLIELSRGTAHRIGQLLIENQRTSATLAGEPFVAQFLTASEEERQAMKPRINRILKNYADTHPDYDAPGLLDKNGIVVASLADILVGKDRSFRGYFRASIKGKSYVSDILVGRATGRPGVFLTNPVVATDDKIVGINIVWLKGDTIWRIIDDVTVGDKGIAYLVDQDGVIIAHPNRDLLYYSLGKMNPAAKEVIRSTIRFGVAKGTDTPLIPENLGMDDFAAELASGKNQGTYRYFSPLDNQNHVIGYSRVKGHPWTIVIDLPEAQFLAPIQLLQVKVWSSVGVLGVIVLLISILLARGITRPIRRLTGAAKAVEQGRPFEPSEIGDITAGHDEIAHFGQVFSTMMIAIRQELAERERVKEVLRESEHKHRLIANNTIDCIWQMNLEFEFTYVNPSVLQMFGFTQDEWIGSSLPEHCSPEDLEYMAGLAMDELKKGAESTGLVFETQLLHKNGRNITVEIASMITFDDDGNPVAFQGITRDITDRKQTEEELAKHRDHLEELIRERTVELEKRVTEVEQLNSAMVNLMEDLRVSNESLELSTRRLDNANKELESFSYSVSHDLRAPLRAIDGFSRLLLEEYPDVLDEQGQHYLQRIRTGTQSMGQLIDDILNLSRIGRQPMEKKEINLESVAEEVYKTLKHEWKNRKVNFTVHQSPPAFADHNLMQIVFTNLFSNALKFTRNKKEVKIETGCKTKDKQTVFFIKDNGVGFDMKYADKLFSPFQRLHHTEEYEGVGVGLSIVQRIIHRHGGRIWVESEIGVGTTFYFTV